MINLSIIIPVYNVEKYITECLFSLSNQIKPNIEVIIINDGSTDNSPQIIDDFISNLPEYFRTFFCVIHQKNRGVSNARNKALKASKGKYIAFIDSDDIVSDNYINEIFFAIQQSPDIIQFNACSFFKENPPQDIPTHSLIGLYTSNATILHEIFSKNKWFSCLRVYRRKYLIDFPFPENMTHFEDAFIVSKIFHEIESVYFINKNIYKYRILESSSTRNLKAKESLLNSCENLMIELINQSKHQEIYAIPLIHFFNIYVEESKKNFGFLKAIKNWNKFSRKIKILNINPNLIINTRERILLKLIFLGIISHYLARKLSKLIK